jgi:hypothetical protein
MAAHSSPRGRWPDVSKAAAGTRVASLPRAPPTPMASARRRAGSTVSTSTRPPRSVAANVAKAAAVVVLPTPPEPHVTTISFAASSCSSWFT